MRWYIEHIIRIIFYRSPYTVFSRGERLRRLSQMRRFETLSGRDTKKDLKMSLRRFK